jgi:hypothetical protein
MRIPTLFYKTPKLRICSKSLSWQLQSQTVKAVTARGSLSRNESPQPALNPGFVGVEFR